MLKMLDTSRAFLAKNLPSALQTNSLREALEALYMLIEDKGFAPPHYYDYNDFGRAAQCVYDDLYYQNHKEPAE